MSLSLHKPTSMLALLAALGSTTLAALPAAAEAAQAGAGGDSRVNDALYHSMQVQ